MSSKNAQAPVRLYNPLLDAIFNAREKSPLKYTIDELANSHLDFCILVPPASVLHNCTDSMRSNLKDLCYNNDEFVRSHIIHTAAGSAPSMAPSLKQHSLIFNTLSGKQLLLKNKVIFTGKGFKKSIRVRVASTGEFVPFSAPFRTGCRVSVIYIEASLYGPQPASESPAKDVLALKGQAASKSHIPSIGFEELLRKFPLLSKTMSRSFYALFHHNNREFVALRTHKKIPLSEIKSLFDVLVHKAVQIVQDSVNADTSDGERTYNLLQSLSSQKPGLDMNRLIHEYVELNMYDHIWSSLIYQYRDIAKGERIDDLESPKTVLTHALYADLSCLSLNQLDIPVSDPWDLNILHKRVAEAIKIFATLSGANVTSQRQKIVVIKETISILTTDVNDAFSGPVIDADTLIGLLIMVVVHSKVPNLECHLFYIRHFGLSHQRDDPHGSENDLGFMSYILSNIDAVIFHLHDSESPAGNSNLSDMSASSARNYEFWYTIQKQDLNLLERFLDTVEEEFDGKELPRHHTLRSRNINGESCFHLAIRTRNPHLFSMLLSRSEQWILLEDLIFDKNTTTNQNLLMTALQEEVPEIVSELIDLLLSSATHEEQFFYCNSRDTNGRTVGHYLSHNLSALDRLGHLINWEVKDINSHTPLFSICRCYDHTDYTELIRKAFKLVRQAHPEGFISYDAHADNAGNTLLHALAKAIPESGILSDSRSLVNVNEMNHKGMTPAALYVRYNRIENLKTLFHDTRLILDLEEPRSCYNLMDYYSFSASKSLRGPNEVFSEIELAIAEKYFHQYYPTNNKSGIGFVNARFDSANGDWAVNVFYSKYNPELSVASKYISLDKLRHYYKISRSLWPMNFFPSEQTFWLNYLRGKPTVPICSKFSSNRMLEHLSMFFALMNYLRPDTTKQLLRTFVRCCKDDQASGLDMMNEVSIMKESARNSAGEVKLTESKIQEIVFFVEYTVSDLSRVQSVLHRFSCLATVAAIKQNDVRSVTDQFFRNISGLGMKFKDDVAEFRRIDAPYSELHKYANWCELCVDELLSKCAQMIEKVRLWKETYSKIKSLNAELHKFEDLVIPHNGPNASNDESMNGIEANGHANGDSNGTLSLSRRSTLTIEEIPVEHENDYSFFNFGLIDSKRSRYRKLVLAKAEEVKKLMDLNVDIKLDHEALAAEISQFMEYRVGVLRFGIKQFTRDSLVSLRNRHYELSKLLNETRKTNQTPTRS